MQREIVPKAALTYDDALSIYSLIVNGLNENNEDDAYLLENLQKRAIRYSGFRSKWYLMDQMERIEQDSDRTSAHDAFISALRIIDRYQKENTWRKNSETTGSVLAILPDMYACFYAWKHDK